MNKKVKLVVVGSIGIDTIKTTTEKKENILGGSASYACVAAAFYTDVGMIGVVGTDFPSSFRKIWEDMSVNLDGLQTEEGKRLDGAVNMKKIWIIGILYQLN